MQKAFGHDVISRINHTIENEGGTEHLRGQIVEQINGMIRDLAEKNNIPIENIYSIGLAGNTTQACKNNVSPQCSGNTSIRCVTSPKAAPEPRRQTLHRRARRC